MIAFHSWSNPGRLRPITSTPRRWPCDGLAFDRETGDSVAILILILPLVLQRHRVVDEVANDGANVTEKVRGYAGGGIAEPLSGHNAFARGLCQRNKLRAAAPRVIQRPK